MIPYGKHHIDEEDIEAVVGVLRSGMLTQGPTIEKFERAVAEYTGARFAVAVSSGTAALHLSALAAGVGPGNALVTSPISFVASANAGLYAGGRVLFADIETATINMCPNSLKETLEQNSDVRAVVPVHFAGLPCDMVAIKKAADFAGAVVIEDAAHALGAIYPDGNRVGSCKNSLMTIFSFHPVKAIAAGEGGMVTTNDEKIYRKLLRLRSHGINKLDDSFLCPDQAVASGAQNPWYYEMQQIGFNYRISDIQCALALSQLKKLDKFIGRRRYLAQRYDAELQNHSALAPAQIVRRDDSAHHIYVVRIDFKACKLDRGGLMKAMRQRGVGSQVHYIPIPAHPYYRQLGHNPAMYPNASSYYDEALSIPLYFDLSDANQDLVASLLRELIS